MTNDTDEQVQRTSLECVPLQESENAAHAKEPRRLERRDGSVSTSWGAARGQRAEPFEPGNKAAVSHGAYSRELVEARTREVLADLKQAAPYLDELLDQVAMEQLLDAEAKRRMLSEYIDAKVAESGVESVKPNVLTEYTRLLTAAQKAASDLGLAPVSRAKLLKDTGWARRLASEDVDQVAARGRRLRGGEPA